jgi:hypothetical protein
VVEETWGRVYENLINKREVERLEEVGSFLEDIFILIDFLEHMCFVVLGITGTKGQETKRFFGVRKLSRLLVDWEDSWEKKNNAWKNLPTIGRTTLKMVIFNRPRRSYFVNIYSLCF